MNCPTSNASSPIYSAAALSPKTTSPNGVAGGFQDWLRDEERRVRLCQIMERYEELGPEEGARRSEAHFYQWIAAELMTEFERPLHHDGPR